MQNKFIRTYSIVNGRSHKHVNLAKIIGNNVSGVFRTLGKGNGRTLQNTRPLPKDSLASLIADLREFSSAKAERKDTPRSLQGS